MLIAGLVLLAVAIGAIVFSRLEAKKAHTARATETLACGDVAALSKGVADEVGGGMFTQRCESVGAAQPGPHGLVDAPESKVDAVWVRTTVIHKYWEMVTTTRDGKTYRDRQEREETVSDNVSSAPFVLTDETGSVAIDPDGADIDRPEKIVDRFEQRSQVEQGGGGLLATLLRSTNDSGTLGFQHQEWVIRHGTRLYVQGEVADRSGALVFAKPQDKGAFLVSTRSEEEIVAHADRNATFAQWGGIAAAVVGVVLVIAGLVA